MNWYNAYLGLGSNQDQPKNQLMIACEHLRNDPSIEIIKTASLYQTPAWGVTEQPDFINSALHIRTQHSPQGLLETVKNIEYQKMLRKKNAHWHQRVIDIDILLYESSRISTEALTIPHPLLTERWFVLLPLLELLPLLPNEVKQQADEFMANNPVPANIIKSDWPALP